MKANAVVILVVDDCPDLRDLVKETLMTVMGYQVLEAEDGIKAFSILRKNHVSGIISDWNMPNMDGLSFLRKIKTDPQYKAIPFMMLTGEMSRKSVMEAMANGVDDFLVKPFSSDDLCKKSAKLVARSPKAKKALI